MTKTMWTVAVALLLATSAPEARAADPNECEAVRCDANVGAELAKCPCPDSRNHGQYVSCVARALNKLAKDGSIPKNCKGRIKRCAAKSICGKPEFVACAVPDEVTECATPCTEDAAATCCADATTACDPAVGCIVSTQCKIKKSDRCDAIPGAVATTATNCCADCPAAP